MDNDITLQEIVDLLPDNEEGDICPACEKGHLIKDAVSNDPYFFDYICDGCGDVFS